MEVQYHIKGGLYLHAGSTKDCATLRELGREGFAHCTEGDEIGEL